MYTASMTDYCVGLAHIATADSDGSPVRSDNTYAAASVGTIINSAVIELTDVIATDIERAADAVDMDAVVIIIMDKAVDDIERTIHCPDIYTVTAIVIYIRIFNCDNRAVTNGRYIYTVGTGIDLKANDSDRVIADGYYRTIRSAFEFSSIWCR